MILLRQCDPCGNKVVELSLDETYYTEADSPELTVTLPATYPAGSSLRVVIKNNNGVVVKSHDYTIPLAANPIILDPLTWGRYTVAAMILYETTRIACKSDALTFFVSKVACTNCGYAPYRIACTIGDGGEFTDLSACADYGTGSARLMLPAPANSISATLVQTASPCVWTAVTNTSPLLAFRQYLDGDCADDDPAITSTSLTWTLTRTSGTEWTLVVTLTATGDEIYRSVTTQALCEDPFNFTGNTATDFLLPGTDHGTGLPDLVGEQAAEANPLNDAVTMPRLQRECGTFTLLRKCVCLCADSPALTHVSPDADATFYCGETVTLVAERSAGNPPCGQAVFEIFSAPGGGLLHAGYAAFVAGTATYVVPAGVVCPNTSYEWRAGIEVDGVRCAYSSKRGFGITNIDWFGLPASITVTSASANALKAYIEAAYPGEVTVYILSRSMGLDYSTGYYGSGSVEIDVDGVPAYYLNFSLWNSGYCYWDNGDIVRMYPGQWVCGPIASGTKFVPMNYDWVNFFADYPNALPPTNDQSAWLEVE